MRHALVPFLAILALSVTACSDKTGPPPAQAPPVPVSAAAAAMYDLPEPFEAGGVVRARATAQIVSRIMATVGSVRVTPGDRVRTGQALVVLDGRDLDANSERATAARAAAEEAATLAAADVQAADAALNLARLTFQRIHDLRSSKSATQQELDEAEAHLKAAESHVKVAQARLAASRAGIQAASAAATAAQVASSFATLVAPFDGMVTEKLVEVGNMASPGTPLVTVEDTRSFRVDVRLDESRAVLVSVGDPVAVRLDATARAPRVSALPDSAPLAGRVAELSRLLDPGSHDFLVKVELPPVEGLRSGMFARAVFRGPVHRALAVPESSIVRTGQLSFVYVVENSKAHLRLVNAGSPVGGLVEVRSGLVEGEWVVTAPPAELTDGRAVSLDGEPRR